MRKDDRKRRRMIRLWISLLVGMLAAVFSGCLHEDLGEDPSVLKEEPMLAWWGTLYPWFCFQDYTQEEPPEISFWLAKVLNW